MSENPGNPKKIVARRSSILKKPPNDADSSDCTDTTTKKLVRRISFCGKKSVKEFMQGEDKQTVWGTSYEESDPKVVNVSDIAATAAPKGNYDVTDMDIEDEPLGTAGDRNKENETPERTMWSSINMASKPLASSTMLDMQIDASPGNKVCFQTAAVKKIPPENSEDFSFMMKTPEKVDREANDPFSWLVDPKIVGNIAIDMEESAKSICRDNDATEQSTIFIASPPSASEMNTESLCNFEISTLHIDEQKKQKRKSHQQEMKRISTGKEIDKLVAGDGMDLTAVGGQVEQTHHMEMTFMGQKEAMEGEKMRKTLYFPTNEDQMNLTRAASKEIPTEKSRKHQDLPPEDDQMDLTESAKNNSARKKISFTAEENPMEMTKIGQENTEGKILDRRTIYFKTQEDGMNITCVGEKAATEEEGSSPGGNEMNLTGISKIPHEMDVTLKEEEGEDPKESRRSNARKTIYYPSNNQIDVTVNVPKGKKSLACMDMTLQHIEQRKDPKEGRKTIYFATEDDNEMNITGSLDGKSQRDVPKPMEASMVLTSQEVNERRKKSLVMQEMEMTLDEGGKGKHFGRRTIHFTKDDGNEMDLIEPLSREEDEEIPAEASKGTPNMDMTLLPGKMRVSGVQSRRTVYFPEEDQMNLTASADQQVVMRGGALQSNMEMTFEPEERVGGRIRKTEYFKDAPLDLTAKSPAVRGEKSLTPNMEMTFLPETCAGDGKKERKTIYFSGEDNQINQTVSQDAFLKTIKEPAENVADKENIPEMNPPNSRGSVMEVDTLTNSCADFKRQTVFLYEDIGMEEPNEEPEPQAVDAQSIPEADQSEMDISMAEEESGETKDEMKRKTIFFKDTTNTPLDETAEAFKLSSVRESIREQVMEKEEESLRQTETFRDDDPMDISMGQQEDEDCLGAVGGICESVYEKENSVELIRKIPMTSFHDTSVRFQINQSEENTMKLIRPGEQTQQQISSLSLRMSLKEPSVMDKTLADVMEMKMISDESYIEVGNSANDSDILPTSSGSNSRENSKSMKINLDNTFVRLGDFDLEALDAKKAPAAVTRNIRRETFTISQQKPPEKRSQIPIVVPKQREPKKSLLETSESSKFTEILPVISAEEQEVTMPGNETIKSLPSANNSTLPEIPNFPKNLPAFKDTAGKRKIQAKDPKFLENFLGKDLLDKLSETKDAEKKLENAIKDLEELEKKCMPTIEKFLKYPSRCQFPRSLSFIKLLRNMVESMPSIWFIEKFFYRGLMLFKHRKITTFEIYIYFDPKQLIDMDSVDSRGILYFKRIKIRDCDWYTLKDPATKSKLWIYLHTKFRRQVLMDHYLLDKYNDSNSLRDFLEYINKICCDIFAARPHIMDIVQMKEIP
ncbi:uncharacterized protein LOC129794201 [Lutzomyia longipalpis]|uniref:uncharacterized protein LOC129794201 n=1 Tax=Lutzomyia longipalpis TaxID=7200 RepID=UPI00248456BD|nr:uncharacterized protein LOC129794201 [Lutzomyia longipalpis]